MHQKMTWGKKYPNEWLLIIDYDSDESGHLISGVVARHSPEKDEVFRLPGVETMNPLNRKVQENKP
ncbi:MAG: hypothetical protein GY749_31785 [Desulfobacteraceae bacterium]|nr:hypothetical protein [Desulfobacteraceae bacterium]